MNHYIISDHIFTQKLDGVKSVDQLPHVENIKSNYLEALTEANRILQESGKKELYIAALYDWKTELYADEKDEEHKVLKFSGEVRVKKIDAGIKVEELNQTDTLAWNKTDMTKTMSVIKDQIWEGYEFREKEIHQLEAQKTNLEKQLEQKLRDENLINSKNKIFLIRFWPPSQNRNLEAKEKLSDEITKLGLSDVRLEIKLNDLYAKHEFSSCEEGSLIKLYTNKMDTLEKKLDFSSEDLRIGKPLMGRQNFTISELLGEAKNEALAEKESLSLKVKF